MEQRYLRHVPTQGYQLGAKLIEFGARALESTSLYEIAQPVLQRLARYTLDTVHLGIVEGDEVLYLEKINSQRGLEMRSRPGHRMPLAITGIGKGIDPQIRTFEGGANRFTVCPLWPLGNPSIIYGTYRARTYDPLLVRQMLSQLS